MAGALHRPSLYFHMCKHFSRHKPLQLVVAPVLLSAQPQTKGARCFFRSPCKQAKMWAVEAEHPVCRGRNRAGPCPGPARKNRAGLCFFENPARPGSSRVLLKSAPGPARVARVL